MNSTTRLEPLSPARAEELFGMLRQASRDDDTALALDDRGYATGLTQADDPRPRHLLGDLDVHA
jgi:hypothetical protein